MSGPKSYTVKIYDVRIEKALRLQSAIEDLYHKVKNYQLADKNRAIIFDTDKFIRKNSKKVKTLLAPLSVKNISTSDYETYKKHGRKLAEIESKLENFLYQLENEKADFLEKQDDYYAYIAYEDYLNYSLQKFNSFKSRVSAYISSYLENDYPEIVQKATALIQKINIETRLGEFTFGFRKIKNQKKNAIIDEIREHESEINIILDEISTTVIKDGSEKMGTTAEISLCKGMDKKTQAINEIIQKMKSFITAVEDHHQVALFEKKMEDLVKSPTFRNDPFYYTELFEEIRVAEKNRIWKKEIQTMTNQLNQNPIHHNCISEKNMLIAKAALLKQKTTLKRYDYDAFMAEWQMFTAKNSDEIRNQMVKNREKQFIKNQLIHSLESLNYKVMNDMQVIDFERETDILFNIPSQSNYLNLRFQPDGSFLYNFLIPENISELNIEMKRQRVGEMETTCAEFKTLLKQLSLNGLNFEVRKEMPSCEKALIQIPKKHRQLVEKKKPTASRTAKEGTTGRKKAI